MSTMTVGGPMFEPPQDEHFKSILRKSGAHYNIFSIESGMAALRVFFPDGEANALNCVLFSTSGVHGTYTTIEDIEQSLTQYGSHPAFLDDGDAEWPDDYYPPRLTVLIVQPRIVCLRYGVVAVELEDIPYLKKLRASSLRELARIGNRNTKSGQGID